MDYSPVSSAIKFRCGAEGQTARFVQSKSGLKNHRNFADSKCVNYEIPLRQTQDCCKSIPVFSLSPQIIPFAAPCAKPAKESGICALP
jgi:hypothetical protein